jgi:hypothetical protein
MLSPAQYEHRMPLFENFIPGIQNDPPQVDDGVAPSSLDIPKDFDPLHRV